MTGSYQDGHVMLVLAPPSLSRWEIALRRLKYSASPSGGGDTATGQKMEEGHFAFLNQPLIGCAESSDHESSVIID